MLIKIKYTFAFTMIFSFIFLTMRFYISEKNIVKVNKSRSLNTLNSTIEHSVPLLKNDTNNIIEYSDDLETFKKNKKKYKFFDLIGK